MKRARRSLPILLVSVAALGAEAGSAGRPVGAEAGERLSEGPRFAEILAEHPRLHFTARMLPELRRKVGAEFKEDYQRMVDWLGSVFEKDTDNMAGLLADYHALVRQLGDVPGIRLPRPSAQFGKRAVEILMRTARAGLPKGPAGGYDPKDDHQSMARAYDWVWQDLSPDERRAGAEWLAAAGARDLQKLQKGQGLWSSRYFESVMPWYIGLAFANDGIRDAEAKTLTDSFQSLMLDGRWLDAQNWCARRHGGVSELGTYGFHHPRRHVLQIDGWRTATGVNYFVQGTSLADAYMVRYYPKYIAYLQQPGYPSRIIKWGQHDVTVGVGGSLLRWMEGALKQADSEMAALNRWILERSKMTREGSPWDTFFHILLGDRSVPPKSPLEVRLPLTQHFEGIGLVVMRTGFKDLEDTAIVAAAPPYRLGGHSWFGWQIPLGFTIDKYGPLAIRRGAYKRGAPHLQNVMRFVDPPNPADGGFGGDSSSPDNVRDFTPESPSYLGGVARLESSAETGLHDYVFTDVRRHYSRHRVERYTRQFVYLRPDRKTASDYLVIFDRCRTAAPTVRKEWQVCSAYAPDVEGSETQLRDGWWEYSGGRQIAIRNDVDPDPYSKRRNGGHGRLFIRTLSPRDIKIVKVGGPGHEFEAYGGGNEAEGADYKYLGDAGAYFSGTYFTRVISTSAAQEENFLHVLQTADSRAVKEMVATERLEGAAVEGAHIGTSPGQREWAVVFARAEGLLDQAEYAVNAWGDTVDHLVADLRPGVVYSIARDGSPVAKAKASPAGVLRFSSKGGGRFTLAR